MHLDFVGGRVGACSKARLPLLARTVWGLPFVETFRTPSEGVPEHVELRLNGFTIGLGTVEAAKDVHGVEAAPGSPAMVLVVWTDDVDEAYGKLVAAGVPTVQPPHNTGNNNRNALLRDPDGNLVEIVAKSS
jgi:lactoylglutathione lyase